MKKTTAHACAALVAATLLVAGCSPTPTQAGSKAAPTATTKTAARAVNPKALSAARNGAARGINLLSKLGDAALKVRNDVNGKPALANAGLSNPKAPVRYRLFAADPQTTATAQANASATLGTNADGSANATLTASNGLVISDDGKGQQVVKDGQGLVIEDDGKGHQVVKDNQGNIENDVVVNVQKSDDANDGNTGDKVETATVENKADALTGETGTSTVKNLKGADGKVKSGEIVYSPDEKAKADGQTDESIQFTSKDANGKDNQLNVTLPADPSNPTGDKAQASLEEKEDSNGDLTTEGDLVMPGGAKVHLVIVVHADGTKEITCVADDYSFQITKVSPDGVGTGFLFDKDPSDPQAVKLGTITLNKGSASDAIAFYKEDGVTLGESIAFKFQP